MPGFFLLMQELNIKAKAKGTNISKLMAQIGNPAFVRWRRQVDVEADLLLLIY